MSRRGDEQQQQSADHSATPFRPLAMMPISKTRSSQSFGLNMVAHAAEPVAAHQSRGPLSAA